MTKSYKPYLSFFLRLFATLTVFLLIWQGIVWITEVPSFILPRPEIVLKVMMVKTSLLIHHTLYTMVEILLGIVLGLVFGTTTALMMTRFQSTERWLLPILVISQAIPVFALAPLLVLWFGYGMLSKVVMAGLIIFFPITSSFYDGLRQTDPGWIDLATTMNGKPWRILRHIRIPAALPALASGIRVGVAVAPIGAIVGEWIGSSAGLGYLMLHANARLQTDLMFAALFVLASLAVSLYTLTDQTLKYLLPWQNYGLK